MSRRVCSIPVESSLTGGRSSRPRACGAAAAAGTACSAHACTIPTQRTQSVRHQKMLRWQNQAGGQRGPAGPCSRLLMRLFVRKSFGACAGNGSGAYLWTRRAASFLSCRICAFSFCHLKIRKHRWITAPPTARQTLVSVEMIASKQPLQNMIPSPPSS